MNVILVAGTGSWDDDGRVDWYAPSSNFSEFLKANGVMPAFDGTPGQERPFIWSTGLGGVPLITRRKVEWAAGGAALEYFVRARPRRDAVDIIVHSHGLQVVLFACAEHGLKVDALISCGSPVRTDMMEIAKRARPNIRRWLHVHSDGSDRWQWFGELFDGHFGIVREHPLADRNDFVPKVGHSELLRDPKQFHHWNDRGWITWLQESATV